MANLECKIQIIVIGMLTFFYEVKSSFLSIVQQKTENALSSKHFQEKPVYKLKRINIYNTLSGQSRTLPLESHLSAMKSACTKNSQDYNNDLVFDESVLLYTHNI